MNKETKSLIDKATVISFATIVCIFIFIALSAIGLVIVIMLPQALEGWKEVYIIIMPTITSVFVAYEIIKKSE